MLRKQVLWVLLFLVLSARPAWAYLDPSSGSMLLQVVLAGIAGLGVAYRLFKDKILSTLGRGRKQDEEAADPETPGGA